MKLRTFTLAVFLLIVDASCWASEQPVNDQDGAPSRGTEYVLFDELFRAARTECMPEVCQLIDLIEIKPKLHGEEVGYSLYAKVNKVRRGPQPMANVVEVYQHDLDLDYYKDGKPYAWVSVSLEMAGRSPRLLHLCLENYLGLKNCDYSLKAKHMIVFSCYDEELIDLLIQSNSALVTGLEKNRSDRVSENEQGDFDTVCLVVFSEDYDLWCRGEDTESSYQWRSELGEFSEDIQRMSGAHVIDVLKKKLKNIIASRGSLAKQKTPLHTESLPMQNSDQSRHIVRLFRDSHDGSLMSQDGKTALRAKDKLYTDVAEKALCGLPDVCFKIHFEPESFRSMLLSGKAMRRDKISLHQLKPEFGFEALGSGQQSATLMSYNPS